MLLNYVRSCENYMIRVVLLISQYTCSCIIDCQCAKKKKVRARPHESRHFSPRSSFRLQTERTSRITAKACPLRSLTNKLYPSLSTSRNIYDNFEQNRTVELSFLDQLLSFLLNIDQLGYNNVVDPIVPVSGSFLHFAEL